MSTMKNIVCLANSRREGGCCFAGKEVLREGKYGSWIRPINSQQEHALSTSQMCLPDGATPKLMDVIVVPLASHNPQVHQCENYVLDVRSSWEKVGTIAFSELPKLTDHTTDNLWLFGDNNDRVPAEYINQVKSSLLLIQPQYLTIVVCATGKVRASFIFNEVRYKLAITDSVAEHRYREKATAPFKIKVPSEGVYLCISLAENLFRGSHYKLVAALIGDNR